MAPTASAQSVPRMELAPFAVVESAPATSSALGDDPDAADANGNADVFNFSGFDPAGYNLNTDAEQGNNW